MARQLDTHTLDGAARHYAAHFLLSNRESPSGARFISGPSYVMQDFYNFDFRDEFDVLHDLIMQELGPRPRERFEALARERFTPREDAVFERVLREKLAITPDGEHIEGAIGTVQLGNRRVGVRHKVVQTRRFGEIVLPKAVYWPVYAGEVEERERGGGGVADPLPEGADPWPIEIMAATNPNISAEVALLALDAIVDQLDEGTTAATIRGRSGAQPADPDATETGTLLFTLTMSDPAFGAAADNAPGALATAAAITDDSSADATGTLGYCRAGATGTGADDHIDGEAGASGADFNFNTVSIVSGSTVSMTSFTVTLPQGATAT